MMERSIMFADDDPRCLLRDHMADAINNTSNGNRAYIIAGWDEICIPIHQLTRAVQWNIENSLENDK
jgi:hypothetical protein